MSIEEVQKEKEAEKEPSVKEVTEAEEEFKKKDEELKAELDKADKEIEEQLIVFEPVALTVERTFTHPDSEDKRVFIQSELGFLSKSKFFRLLSGTVRLASEDQGSTLTDFLSDIFGDDPLNKIQDQDNEAEELIGLILRLVELTPDFIESLYVLALNIKPADEIWFRESLDSLTDDEGFDILETFVAQNGKAIKSFFTERLRRVAKRFQQEISEGK